MPCQTGFRRSFAHLVEVAHKVSAGLIDLHRWMVSMFFAWLWAHNLVLNGFEACLKKSIAAFYLTHFLTFYLAFFWHSI